MVDSFETVKEIYIVQEYVKGVSLLQYIKSKGSRRIVEEEKAKSIFRQIAEGIRYMHDMQICHRDIKMENILIDEKGMVKIIDFGFSVCTPPDSRLKIYCGTPSYMCPEIVTKKDYSGFQADIWSLGVLLYLLLTGMYPFKGASERELYSKIGKGIYAWNTEINDYARRLVGKMLVVQGEKRINIKEVCSDKWFTS
jgi:serine/threonine protein kinase